MKNIDKVCTICLQNDWEDIDHLRSDPANMILCKNCGFITYDRFCDEAEYHAYYEKDYRPGKVVTVSNLITTNRKIGYHDRFLRSHLKDKKNLRVGEIGAGIGYFLRWMRDVHGASEISGSELTGYMRRYGKWAFNVDITENFDYGKQYDFIGSYHTLEHIPDVRDVLLKLHDCLAPGGMIYIAMPVWMDELMKFGGGAFTTFDDHFHPDHVNAWSRWHLRQLLAMTGWRIKDENSFMYGWTALLEKGEIKTMETPPKSTDEILTQLSDMKRAAIAYRKGEFQEAIRLYPRFVDAYFAQIGSLVKAFDKQMELCEIGEKFCPNTKMFNIQRGMLLFQRNRYEEAEHELMIGLDAKPHDDNILKHLGLIYLYRGEALLKQDYEKGRDVLRRAVSIFDKIIGINPMTYSECFDLIAYIFSTTPMPEELKNAIKFTVPHAEGAPYMHIVS